MNESEIKPNRIDRVKKHFKDNKKIYISVGVTTVTVAGITWVIMRRHNLQNVSPVIHGTTRPVIHGTGESVVNNIASKTFLGDKL